MKAYAILRRVSPWSTFLLLVFAIHSGCGKKEDDGEALRKSRASVSDDGMTVRIPGGSPGLRQIQTVVVSKGIATVSVLAPARIVAVVSAAEGTQDKIILFDSPEVTSLYSQYRQSKTSVLRTANNLSRIRNMYENQTATGKDVNEAETDAANALAAKSEYEAKLRALGFNALELDNVPAGRVWLISDVIDAQLSEVQKGEDVDIVFSSYPEKKYTGKADAIGDVIDPVTRTVKVRVTLPNVHGKLLPGMFARVDFGDPLKSVIILPLSAVVTVDAKDYVFVETAPGEYRRREVTTVHSSSTGVVVKEGLQDGEHVVAEGVMLLKGLSFGY